MITDPVSPCAKKCYEKLLTHRYPYLDRARACSRYTIPSLVPPEGASGSTRLHRPFQSVAARGVNNLASRLLLTLLPPTRKPFRLVIAEDLKQSIPQEDFGQWEQALSAIELRVLARMEALGLRPHVYEAMRHLIVAGNVLLFLNDKNSRVFGLPQYVVRRSPAGEVQEIVVKEMVGRDDLPDEFITELMANMATRPAYPNEMWEQYTHIHQQSGGSWRVYQEVHGKIVPGSEGTYAADKCPWLALRWTRIDGEHYGRSHCDEYFGDILAAESLSRSIIRASAIAAKVLFLVRPNSTLDPSDLEKAEEGQFVDGDSEDITALQLDKYHDFAIAQKTLDDVIGRLSYAFLLNSAVRRQGERVTAEEIRYMASELEDTLGGVYSVLSVEFQLPLIRTIMAMMERDGSLPPLPKKDVFPTIVTGIDALGRNHEGARLDAFLGGAIQMFGPGVAQYVNMSEYLRRRAASLDVETPGLVRSEEEIAQMRQAQMATSIVEKATPNATKAIGDRMNAQAGVE